MILNKHITSISVKNSVISNAHVSYIAHCGSDVSKACKDVIMEMILSPTIPDESVCWKKPTQAYATTEVRYAGQEHGLIYLAGTNLIKAGKHYITFTPLRRIDNNIKLLRYIQQTGTFIWIGGDLNVMLSFVGRSNSSVLITTTTLITPTTACTFRAKNRKILVDIIKHIHKRQKMISVQAFNIGNMFLHSLTITSIFCKSQQLLHMV